MCLSFDTPPSFISFDINFFHICVWMILSVCPSKIVRFIAFNKVRFIT